jgi:hypothetical protein
MNRITSIVFLAICMTIGCNQPSPPKSKSEPAAQSIRNPATGRNEPSALEDETKAFEDSRLQSYFERYCDYTGGMGIGFVASHTYDYQFRQHLKKTNDRELKRLFVLQHLYRDLDFAARDYQEGKIRIGKADYREMTDVEKLDAKKEINRILDDLAAFDPEDPEREIAKTREKLK